MTLDKHNIAQRFARAGQSYQRQAVVQQKIAQHLAEQIAVFCPESWSKVFEMGCGSGYLTRQLLNQRSLPHLYLNDLYAEVQQHFQDLSSVQWYLGDIEQIRWPDALDAIVSTSALQWMADLDAVFRHCYASLLPQGALCFSSFGPDNLLQIKQLTGQGLHYFTLKQLREKLQAAGFEILYLEQQRQQLYFAQPQAVLQHLKATGVTATNRSYRWTKQSLQQFYRGYQQFSTTGGQGEVLYPLTYHPIYCIARRRV